MTNGDAKERNDHIAFLKPNGSFLPIEAQKLAGLDMSRPNPAQIACRIFAGLVDELEILL